MVGSCSPLVYRFKRHICQTANADRYIVRYTRHVRKRIPHAYYRPPTPLHPNDQACQCLSRAWGSKKNSSQVPISIHQSVTLTMPGAFLAARMLSASIKLRAQCRLPGDSPSASLLSSLITSSLLQRCFGEMSKWPVGRSRTASSLGR